MESAEKKRDGSASRFEGRALRAVAGPGKREAVARSGVLLNSRLEEQTLGELLNLLNNPYESIHQEIRISHRVERNLALGVSHAGRVDTP
jgi:hypothetical protein